MKMRTMLILTLLSVGLLLAGTGIADADVTKSVPASATVTGVSTLSVEPVTYGGGTAAAIAFGSVSPGAGFLAAPQYVKVDHDDNSLAWEIKIYTDNFATEPSTTTWGYNYGGMIGLVPGARLSMGWHARVDNSLTLASAFAAEDPAADPTEGWNFVKDKSDKDIPGTGEDESWLGPLGDASYANVAYGSPTWQRVIDPLVGPPDYSYVDGDKT
ncbi:MAG: hypothetical protein V3U97_04760, partial [bacterium]